MEPVLLSSAFDDNARPRWSPFEVVLFRFVLCYLLLYIVPFPLEQLASLIDMVPESFADEPPESGASKFISEWVAKPYQNQMDKAVLWVGETTDTAVTWDMVTTCVNPDSSDQLSKFRPTLTNRHDSSPSSAESLRSLRPGSR